MIYHTSTRRRVVTTIGELAVAIPGLSAAQPPDQRNFRTQHSGDEEVPPVDTNAQDQAKFQLTRAGEELRYKLIVANIENVLMAHIHLASAGENGDVVAWLYPEDGPPPELIEGRFDGVLAEDTITEDDLVGPLADADLNNLPDEIQAGNTYVNVHTTQHPAGEIRGQIH